ncbi:MAG TPA: hypothetical protein VF017_15925 [Thermoanaerobaculia bacterium]|nr:hypothetical protein [Thermoanaerobaculia bacterium]
MSSNRVESITEKARNKGGLGCAIAFVLLFGVVGLVMTVLVLSAGQLEPGAWPALLVPIVFTIVGFGGAYLLWRFGRKAATTEPASWQPAVPEAAGPAPALGLFPGEGPVELQPSAGPWGKLLGITFVALFWNGITGVFVVTCVGGWQSGSGDGCLTIFLIPFVLVGLALLAGVPYQILAMFNPRPVISLNRARVALGQSLEIGWRFRGNPARIRELTIEIEGREEATYRQGTTTKTDRQVFARLSVIVAADPMTIERGWASVTIPLETMHSFEATRNKVVWTLKVAGRIDSWPDVGEDFPLIVLPPEVGR